MSETLRLVDYSPAYDGALSAFALSVRLSAMQDRRFLNHYYLDNAWSRLFLVVDQESANCLGIIGVDMLDFMAQGAPVRIAFATHFYSLKPGVGGMLWLKWMKLGDQGLVFGGSQDTHRIITARNFQYYPGINLYSMNARFEGYREDSSAKKLVKQSLRPFFRKKLSEYASKDLLRRFSDVSIRERSHFDAGMLPPSDPFTARFCPSVDYLNWRYNPALQYVRYRAFEILRSGATVGYCILNRGPAEWIVSHADGSDPEALAAGILKAIYLAGEAAGRNMKVVLASSHPAMQTLFTQNGFRLSAASYPFAAGALRGARNLGDPKGWLVSFGIGDNDLRTHLFWPS